MTADNIYVIIVAGGSGKRLSTSLPKQFIKVNGIPIIIHTIRKFDLALPDYNLIVVMNAEWESYWKGLAAKYGVREHSLVDGGEERFFSVRNALNSIDSIAPEDVVIVHDAVRPLVDERVIKNVVTESKNTGSAIPILPVSDSLRKRKKETFYPVDRRDFVLVQTPQGFNLEKLKMAYLTDFRESFTDDATVYEYAGLELTYIKGNKENIKITYPADLSLAECLLKK